MKSFLLKGKKPIIKWGMLPENVFFRGSIPEGFSLAVSPSDNYVVVDIDMHGDINGFDNVPDNLFKEMTQTIHYNTKNSGMHAWLKYTGAKKLANKPSGFGIDLRTDRGYAVWYPTRDFKECIPEIKNTSLEMNVWLEELFCFVGKKKK
jgi:hypothetical protein